MEADYGTVGMQKIITTVGNVVSGSARAKAVSYTHLRKLAEHGNGIALLFNRCDSKMFQDVIFETATGMKFLRHRLRFYRPDEMCIRDSTRTVAAMVAAFGTEAVAEGYYREQVDDILKHYTCLLYTSIRQPVAKPDGLL